MCCVSIVGPCRAADAGGCAYAAAAAAAGAQMQLRLLLQLLLLHAEIANTANDNNHITSSIP